MGLGQGKIFSPLEVRASLGVKAEAARSFNPLLQNQLQRGLDLQEASQLFFMLSDGRSWCCCGGWCQSALVVSSKRLMGLVDRLVMEHGNGSCQSFVVADAADDVPRSICWQIVDMIS